KIVGAYQGVGTADVEVGTVTLSLMVKMPDGTIAPVTFNALPVVRNRFAGMAAEVPGLKISGRIDVPTGTDDQQTSAQAVTARIVATLTDQSGRAGKLIAVQAPESRAGALIPEPPATTTTSDPAPPADSTGSGGTSGGTIGRRLALWASPSKRLDAHIRIELSRSVASPSLTCFMRSSR